MTAGPNGEQRRSNDIGELVPRPDPTVFTNEAIERASKAVIAYVDGQLQVRDERLSGIDRATELRLAGIEGIPQQIDDKVGQIRELVDEKFVSVRTELGSVQTQFKERDTRSEREARDNKLAVDAAFAAQEKQAVAQQDANTEKIDKSERATQDTIKTNQELSRSKTDELTKSIDEVKLQVAAILASRVGATESRAEGRAQIGSGTAILAGLVGLVFLALALYAATRSGAATVLLLEGAA